MGLVLKSADENQLMANVEETKRIQEVHQLTHSLNLYKREKRAVQEHNQSVVNIMIIVSLVSVVINFITFGIIITLGIFLTTKVCDLNDD